MIRIGHEAYIRVTVISQRENQVRCLPVNQEHEAFDGVGFFPGYLVVDQDAIAESPLEIPVEECPIMYGGEQINKRRKAKQ